jgi:acyl carrier protein
MTPFGNDPGNAQQAFICLHSVALNMNRKNEIRNFVVTTFLLGDGSQLKDQISLLEGGIIDSTGVLELVLFLEEEYGIKVAQEEMLPENLDSIENIDRFVALKLNAFVGGAVHGAK